ncbi:MAG: DNA gyrase subunit A [Clostridiaceae bacterium]|jgi:DNA gyrase subunit A|nr:DNA gyrase subunit A [Clostridiaceae bacterium]
MALEPKNKNNYQLREAAVDQAFQNPDNVVIPVDLDDEMRKSFIDYAMSVISDRALPDVRDGLKPVHRRILYSMYTQGFTWDKPHRKSATTIGDVLGRFHPHGDASVYDALVRLAQDFSMRHPLIDGHGNFGSRDGDPPAAYRYTEARLTRLGTEMMADLNKNTVDFQPNYDDRFEEPTVLPAGFPNLLVSGSTGIAVGMVTNIPPHNLREVIEGTIHLIDDPEATTDDLMEFIPAPDFPTGGQIMGLSGSRSAYRRGRGRIVVRGHADIEEVAGNRYRIIIRSLPYMVNKARLIERIAELVRDKRIEGISDVRDESDRHDAIRIVVELRRDATPMVVLNQLYRHTQLQDTFGANMLALVPEEGKYVPQQHSLKEMLEHFIGHQREVITRRITFDLDRAEARLHLVEGLQLAIDHIDQVISIIRSSKDEEEAKKRLCERFAFSDRQAQHVVDMRLGRLSGLEREKLMAEHEDLTGKIEGFRLILGDPDRLHGVMKEELRAVAARYGDDRRTEIVPAGEYEIDDEELIEEEQVVIAMTHAGYIKRMPVDVYSAQHRGGRGITAMLPREDDFVDTIIITSTHQTLLFFTDYGKCYRLKGYQIPESGRMARGMAIVNLLHLEPGEKVRTLIQIDSFDQGGYLVTATAKGMVKKTALADYVNIHKRGLIAINLREDDRLVNVRLSDDDHDLILVTRKGMSIRFAESSVRATGRNTMGVRGISLSKDDEVIGMVATYSDDTLLVVTENGFGKRSRLSDYRPQNRAGKGLITYRTTKRTGKLVGVVQVNDTDDVLLVNDLGIIIRFRASEIPVLGRNTSGVTLMRSREGLVVDISIVSAEEDEEHETVNGMPLPEDANDEPLVSEDDEDTETEATE